MKNTILVTALLLFSTAMFAQATWENNNPTANSPTGFLGWDDITNENLDVLQNNTLRQRFTSVNWTGNNGLPPVNNVSRLYMGQSGNYQTPFSMLHMGTLNNPTLQRDWMNVGITMGASNDILHVGILQRATPGSSVHQADAVIAWGCNDDIFDPTKGPDNLRFLFITPTNAFPPVGGGPADGNTEQGRETMRITPMGNVGVGDFSSMPSGLDEQPTHRLDVSGTARLRQVPNGTPDVVITGVEADNAGDYILNYSTLESFVNDIVCDWDIVNGGDDVATGYTAGCVEGSVLIGTDQPQSSKVFMTKDYAGTTLRVEATSGTGFSELAGHFIAENPSGFSSQGVFGEARNANLNTGVVGTAEKGKVNFGVVGSATKATLINYGVYGLAEGSEEPAPANNVGSYGKASGYAAPLNFGGYFEACDALKNIGVYAEACGTAGTSAHFAGGIVITGGELSLSDESIKMELSEIESAVDIINQLQPKQYNFNTTDFPHLHLKGEKSYGFSAQEVQEVLPEIVGEIHHPAKYDTSGTIISPSEDLLGIHYQEFIAILTAGIKEQQVQITEQAQSIDDLQQSLNNQNDLIAQMMDQMAALGNQISDCCEGGFRYNPTNEGHGNLNNKPAPNGNVLEQNVPNPFRSQTTISYKLEQGGKVTLNIYDRNGKPLATLVEAEQQAGEYRYQWDASGLPAGVYNYALYVDGELLVKKAIKLAD